MYFPTTHSLFYVTRKIQNLTQNANASGGLPRKNDGSARRKFLENTLKGTRITPDGRGY